MKLGAVPNNGLVGPNPYPLHTAWWWIYNAWDGVPGSLLPPLKITGPGPYVGIPAGQGLDVTGWRADCTSTTTTYGAGGPISRDNENPPGTPVDAGYGSPYMITGLSNTTLTQMITPEVINQNGTLTMTGNAEEHATAGKYPNAFGDLVIAVISIMGGQIVGAAIAAGSAVGAAAGDGTAIVAGPSDAVVTTGVDATGALPDLPTVVGPTGSIVTTGVDATGALPDIPTSPTAVTAPIDTGYTPPVDTPYTPEPGTAGNPMQLPPDLQPNYVPPAPVDSITALTPADIASMSPAEIASFSGGELQTALDAAGIGAGSSALPSAGQLASGASGIGKLIGGVVSAITGGARASGGGITSNQFGTTSPGAMSLVILAGVGVLLLSGKKK